MNFLQNKGGELIDLAVAAGVNILDDSAMFPSYFWYLPAAVKRACSAQVQMWAATSGTCGSESHVSEFTPAGDLQTLAELAMFTTAPAQWLSMAQGWVVIAEGEGTHIQDMAELDEMLWCEALLSEYQNEQGFTEEHGFNLAMLLKYDPDEFLRVCKEAATLYTMPMAGRMFDTALHDRLEELKHGN